MAWPSPWSGRPAAVGAMSDPGPASALVEAIVTVLAGALSGLDGAPCPVWDAAAPQGQACPYVVIDGQEAAPGPELAVRRDQHLVRLSVWSTYAGQREVQQILEQIQGLLERTQLPLAGGHRMVRLRVVRLSSAPDADGATVTGFVTLRARVTRA